MDLTEKGRSSERWYKPMQAREPAVGFGLAAAEHIVQQRYPDHIVSVVDTSTVLRGGWALGGSQRDKGSRPRPDYLTEAWKPGEPSKVTFVVCRGNHQKPSKRTSRTRGTTIQQLVKGSELTEGMQIGPWHRGDLQTDPDGIAVDRRDHRLGDPAIVPYRSVMSSIQPFTSSPPVNAETSLKSPPTPKDRPAPPYSTTHCTLSSASMSRISAVSSRIRARLKGFCSCAPVNSASRTPSSFFEHAMDS